MNTRSISSGCCNRNDNLLEMRLFFEFLQFAIGNRESLSCGIKDADWQRLFDLCKRQTLLGIGFNAVEKLHAIGIDCPSNLRMQWMALAFQIEKQNEKITKQCRELTKMYEHDGLQCCILKGQGNLLNYPEELRMRRIPGDIDVWCIPPMEGLDIAVATGRNSVEYVNYRGVNAVIEYAKLQFRLCRVDKQPRAIYHHIDAPSIGGTEVEIHYRPSFCRSLIRNYRMRKWFADHAYECTKNTCHYGFSIPTASVNVIYQMCHLFNHYFHEGIGLRQLMDYYYTLKVWHNDWKEQQDLLSQGMWSEGLGIPVMSAEEVMSVLRSFGMAKFASAVMYVLHEAFALPTHYYICEPNEKEGRKLLAEIMQGGNFGQYDTRDAALKEGGMMKHGVWKLKRVMRLVSSYPEESLWEPVFRVYHLLWRIVHR